MTMLRVLKGGGMRCEKRREYLVLSDVIVKRYYILCCLESEMCLEYNTV